MKYVILALLLLSTRVAEAQFNYTLTGNPVNTTGWTLGAPTTYVSGANVVLTDPVNTAAGYIYYSTPVSLTGCSQFTVTFDFQITNSSAPPADGIAFWYITAPPTGFINGQGIGMPNNPTGLALILDTYDNDASVNNPLISLRYLNNTNYQEGTNIGQLTPDLTNQAFMTNGNWHTCQMVYNNGNISVSMNGGVPIMTAYSLLNITGYFGFSASTGASFSLHSIRNVTITGATLAVPVVNTPVTYCQFDAAVPLTATGTDLKWYTSPTGGTPLATAPTPNTSTAGTYYWYVSQTVPGCGESDRDTVEVIINPKPAPPIINYVNSYCTGEPFVPFIGTNLLWYDTSTGGVGSVTAPAISTAVSDSFTWYVSRVVDGCESDRSTIKVKVNESPVAGFTYDLRLGCEQDTVVFTNTSTSADTYQWDFGDGTGDTSTNPTHIYPVQGVYLVKLKTINANGCLDSVTQSINTIHELIAAFSPDNDTICQNGFVSFTNQSTAATPSFYWDFGDGVLDSTANPIHTYTTPGVFTVRLIVRELNLDCFDTAYQTIVVDSLPYISFAITDSVLCEGQGITFDADYLAMGNLGISWDFGGVTGFGADPIHYTFDTAGIYNVVLTANYRVCPDATFAKLININPYPRLDLGRDTTMCPNGAAIVLGDNLNSGNPDVRWAWSTGDTTAVIAVRHPARYTLRASLNGCSTDDSVEVFKDCYIDVPNIFTPNGDNVNDYFLPRQLLSKSVSAFSMRVYNRWGSIIFETTRPDGRGWDGKFNDQPQPTGVYVYIIDATFANGVKEHYTGNVTLLR